MRCEDFLSQADAQAALVKYPNLDPNGDGIACSVQPYGDVAGVTYLPPLSNLSGGCSGQNQSLSWDAVSGAEGYWIEWSEDGGATWDSIDSGASGWPGTTWTQDPGNPYGPQGTGARLYRVKPVNETLGLYMASWRTVQCASCA